MTASPFMALLVDQYGPASVAYPRTPERVEARARLLHHRHAETHDLRTSWDDITAQARLEWRRRAAKGWA